MLNTFQLRALNIAPYSNSKTQPVIQKSVENQSFHIQFQGNTEKKAQKNRKSLFEKMSQRVEMRFRKSGDWWVNKKYGDEIDVLHQNIIQPEHSQSEFVVKLVQAARLFSGFSPIDTEVNLEDCRLEEIVNSDEACIFVINHDNQSQDPVMLSILNVLLYEMYIEQGRAETCPLPKIILNEDIIRSKSAQQQEIFEKLGAVGVDASLTGNNKNNARVMMGLLQDFIKDDNHIFMFPEGKLSIYKHLDSRSKFQPGAAEMVRLALRKKDRVKVVPIGFAFEKKKKEALGSIHIGEPVYFTKADDKIMASVGNVTPAEASRPYQYFFWERPLPRQMTRREFLAPWLLKPSDSSRPPTPFCEENGVPYKVLTKKGEPIKGKEQASFITDVMVENMDIVKHRARATVPDELESEAELV